LILIRLNFDSICVFIIVGADSGFVIGSVSAFSFFSSSLVCLFPEGNNIGINASLYNAVIGIVGLGGWQCGMNFFVGGLVSIIIVILLSTVYTGSSNSAAGSCWYY
jgi:hypothetical protein